MKTTKVLIEQGKQIYHASGSDQFDSGVSLVTGKKYAFYMVGLMHGYCHHIHEFVFFLY